MMTLGLTGDFPAMVSLVLGDEQDGVRAFVIESCASHGKPGERPVMVEHCRGKVVESSSELLTPEDRIPEGPVPESHGLMGSLKLQDLGPEGLKALRERHYSCEHPTRESFYQAYTTEGTNEYSEGFQLTTGLWLDPLGLTYLARLEYDSEAWVKEGGFFAMELLDSVTHLSLCQASRNVISYAGGYEAGHFLRTPTTRELWVQWVPDRKMTQTGRKKVSGDFLLYDADGRLCAYIQKAFTISVIRNSYYKLCDVRYQPWDVPPAAAPLSLAMRASFAKTLEAWGHEDNERMNAWVAKELARRGVTVAGPGEGGDLAALGESALGSELVMMPPVARLGDRIPDLLDQAAERLLLTTKPAAGEGAEGARPGLSEEEMMELSRLACLLDAEAVAVADALIVLAKASQAEMGGEGSGSPLVFRVLEVADAAVPTVAEALAALPLPSGVIFECFVASHDSQVVRSLGKTIHMQRSASSVRLRRCLLPREGAQVVEFKDLTFHAVVFNEWARSGIQSFAPPSSAPEEQAPAVAPAAMALRRLKTFLMPGAGVIVRGLAPRPLWLELLSSLAPSPLPLTDAVGEAAKVSVMDGLARDWDEALTSCGGGVAQKGERVGGSVVLGSMGRGLGIKDGRFILVASSAEQATLFRQEVASLDLAEAGAVVALQPLIVDDTTSVDDLEAAMREAVSTRDEAEGGVEEAKENGPLGSDSAACPLSGFIFAAAMDDASEIGGKGFSRLLRFSQVRPSWELLVIHADEGWR
jgi:hypothetical protein